MKREHETCVQQISRCTLLLLLLLLLLPCLGLFLKVCIENATLQSPVSSLHRRPRQQWTFVKLEYFGSNN
ncbi:uncharacterized protein Dvir_GJ26491 [Drosophila virilis]|uniref:Uncharacterized protein n=1 Tax=Drosophila virilis TaxID=7244 RepID=A0A0Q9WC06_DROVI|nr:uncharacterized protein Dvir_GJ26491 [Drosophila virilis]